MVQLSPHPPDTSAGAWVISPNAFMLRATEEIDFIAAYIARYDAWYLIPLELLGRLKNIRLYPSGRKLKRRGGRYEQYREAWHLLKDENAAQP